jgi:ribosome biogenesis GTPase A
MDESSGFGTIHDSNIVGKYRAIEYKSDTPGASGGLEVSNREESMADRIANARQNHVKKQARPSNPNKPSSPNKPSTKHYGVYDHDHDRDHDYNSFTPLSLTIRHNIKHDGTCPGCGIKFQSKTENKVGYIPEKQMDIVKQCIEWENGERGSSAAATAAAAKEWNAEDEVNDLLNMKNAMLPYAAATATATAATTTNMIDDDGMITPPFQPPEKPIICRRCFDLNNGKIPNKSDMPTAENSKSVVGYSTDDNVSQPNQQSDPYLSRESFVELLTSSLKAHHENSIILILVDLWDFGPAGALEPINEILSKFDNPPPVILGINKADLFPKNLGALRGESWVRRELAYHNIECVGNIRGGVRLISAKTGAGVRSLITKVVKVMEDHDRKNVFVCGGANVGKSTLLNRLIEQNAEYHAGSKGGKARPGAKKRNAKGVTTSPLPGTTLGVIKMDLGDGKTLMDTPGLLIEGSMTKLMSGEEMKMITPGKGTMPVTFRVEPGSSLLIGGVARVDNAHDPAEKNKAFMVTVWVGGEMYVHATKTEKAEDVLRKHVGRMITPPLVEYASDAEREADVENIKGQERLAALGPFKDHRFEIEGKGWLESAADISLRGLGWVSITGCGTSQINVRVPESVGVDVRPPLMPFDNWEYTGKFTGGRVMSRQKQKKGQRGGMGVRKPKSH